MTNNIFANTTSSVSALMNLNAVEFVKQELNGLGGHRLVLALGQRDAAQIANIIRVLLRGKHKCGHRKFAVLRPVI
jgi:hypothetical protein